MSWNESGNGHNRPGQGGNQGPNDLDKIVQEWQKKLSAMFGGGGGGGGRRGAPAGSGGIGGFAVLLMALFAWGFTGWYRVDQAEQAIVLRFGEYIETTNPGLRWHFPYPIETVEKVNVAEVNTFEKKNQMLTADEAFVVVGIAVQYRRVDPMKHQFNVRDPDETLRQVSESAIREVVGKSKLDNILVENQAIIALDTRTLIQETLNLYEAGIEIVSVNLQEVEFPGEVSDAVQDAIKAREDQQTLILSAETYANDIVPRARGVAARNIQNAEAYRERVITRAEGDASRFEALLTEYKLAPRVTRDRLYIEAMEEVLTDSNKVFLDIGSGSNLTVLPLAELLKQRDIAAGTAALTTLREQAQKPKYEAADSADDARARRKR